MMRILLTESNTNRPVLMGVQEISYNRIDLILRIRSCSCEAVIDGIAESPALAAMRELYKKGKADLTDYDASFNRNNRA